MDKFFDTKLIASKFLAGWEWVAQKVLAPGSLIQLLVIGLAILIALLISRSLKPRLRELVKGKDWSQRQIGQFLKALIDLSAPVVALLILWLAAGVGGRMDWSVHLLETAASLLSAWAIIRLTSSLVRDPRLSRFIAVAAWTVAALNILDLLNPTVALLDSVSVMIRDVRISLLGLIKGLFILAVLLRLAVGGSRMMEKRIRNLDSLTPSVQVLLTKSVKVTLLVLAIIAALSVIGIDLTTFAFFSGAVGLGLGFGLQKVVSNLVSGVILLLDKSIKPGDVIEVGGTFGRIKSLNARFVSVITRDGSEFLIPNEDLITHQVINWSFSDRLVRLKVPLGIAYNSDLRLAQSLAVEAASAVGRVLARPAPVCRIMGFGDSSVDLELRVWIEDPENGVANIKSAIFLEVWDRFKEHGIEIPFPQRDVHLKPLPGAVKLQDQGE